MSDDTPFVPPTDADGNPVNNSGISEIVAPVPGTNNYIGIYSPSNGGEPVRGIITYDAAGNPINILLGRSAWQDPFFWERLGGDLIGTVTVEDDVPLPPPPPPPPPPTPEVPPAAFNFGWNFNSASFNQTKSYSVARFSFDSDFYL